MLPDELHIILSFHLDSRERAEEYQRSDTYASCEIRKILKSNSLLWQRRKRNTRELSSWTYIFFFYGRIGPARRVAINFRWRHAKVTREAFSNASTDNWKYTMEYEKDESPVFYSLVDEKLWSIAEDTRTIRVFGDKKVLTALTFSWKSANMLWIEFRWNFRVFKLLHFFLVFKGFQLSSFMEFNFYNEIFESLIL